MNAHQPTKANLSPAIALTAPELAALIIANSNGAAQMLQQIMMPGNPNTLAPVLDALQRATGLVHMLAAMRTAQDNTPAAVEAVQKTEE